MPEKVTEEWINDQIDKSKVIFHRIEDTTVTICVIELPSRYVLVGHSACINLWDYDQEVGEEIAFNNAKDKLWALEGYKRKALS